MDTSKTSPLEAIAPAVRAYVAGLDDDPRPVFEGDWNSASGKDKGDHSERVRLWKERTGQSRAKTSRGLDSGMDAQSAPHDARQPIANAAERRTLEAIRDDTHAHDSDRIRAAQTLIGMDTRTLEGGANGSDLVALKDILALLEAPERLAWLQGERLAVPTPSRGLASA